MDAELPHCAICLKPVTAGDRCQQHENDCHHFAVIIGGNLTCRLCGMIYRVDMAGSRWIKQEDTNNAG